MSPYGTLAACCMAYDRYMPMIRAAATVKVAQVAHLLIGVSFKVVAALHHYRATGRWSCWWMPILIDLPRGMHACMYRCSMAANSHGLSLSLDYIRQLRTLHG